MAATAPPAPPSAQALGLPVPGALQLALFAALYFAGARLGMLAAMPEGIAILRPCSAVVLAALLRFGGERLPALGVVAIAAELLADVPTFSASEALAFGLINFTEAAGAFLLLRRVGFERDFAAPADVWKFFVAAPVLAAGAASLAGAAV